jgi:hypothetical protein
METSMPPDDVGLLKSSLGPTLALLSAGAAIIHFVVVPGHWDEHWSQGLFFVVAAVAQLLWAVWILFAPSRALYLAGAAGNAAIAAMWIVTRTAGIPLAGADEREAVQFADALVTGFEVLLVLGALALARRTLVPRAYGGEWRRALGITLLGALVATALTTAALLSLVQL